MTRPHDKLLSDIDAFLEETGMGPSYFGRIAARNTELVARLRDGRRIWPETEAEIRNFMSAERARRATQPPQKEAV